MKQVFLQICLKTSATIACRLAPKQKAFLVRLVKDNLPQVITVAVGDGANDVTMILEAHVGVGIRGKEGTQAVQASDYAVAEFQHLSNLFLAHGRMGYRRVGFFLCYYFYKNIALAVADVVWTNYNGFSGQIFYLEWFTTCYNAFFTSFPAIFCIALDQDVPNLVAAANPQLYEAGPRRYFFSGTIFARWVFFAVIHGVVCWYVPMTALVGPVRSDGVVMGFWWASFVSFSSMIILVNLKLAMNTNYWRRWNWRMLIFSIVFYFCFALAFSIGKVGSFKFLALRLQWQMWNLGFDAATNPLAWIIGLMTPVIALLPDLVYEGLRYNFRPNPLDVQMYHCRAAHKPSGFGCGGPATPEDAEFVRIAPTRPGTHPIVDKLPRADVMKAGADINLYSLKKKKGPPTAQDVSAAKVADTGKKGGSAWTPVLTPRYLCCILLTFGVIMTILGCLMLSAVSGIKEVEVDYSAKSDCIGGGTTSTSQLGVKVCTVSMDITEDMEGPFNLFYEVDGFNQNHKKVVQSGHIAQFRSGTIDDDAEDSFAALKMWLPSSVEKRMPGCYPWCSTGGGSSCENTEWGVNNKVYYPCGLRAKNVFNDSFAVLGDTSAGEPGILALDSDPQKISFAGDVDYKFKNLDPEAQFPGTGWDDVADGDDGQVKEYLKDKSYQDVLEMWLIPPATGATRDGASGFTSFPPTRCKGDTLGTLKPKECWNYKGWRSNEADWQSLGNSRAQCKFEGSFFNAETGSVTTVTNGANCQQEPVPEGWGLENAHFINWMRVSGLPTFRKLYGVLDISSLKKGRKLQIRVKSAFPTWDIGGKKSLILTTQRWTGIRQTACGILLVAVGILSCLLGIGFLMLLLSRPHHLASIRYMDWKLKSGGAPPPAEAPEEAREIEPEPNAVVPVEPDFQEAQKVADAPEPVVVEGTEDSRPSNQPFAAPSAEAKPVESSIGAADISDGIAAAAAATTTEEIAQDEPAARETTERSDIGICPWAVQPCCNYKQ